MRVARPSEEGASAVEYGVMVALVAAIIIAVVIVVGRQSCEGFESSSQQMGAVATAVSTPGANCS